MGFDDTADSPHLILGLGFPTTDNPSDPSKMLSKTPKKLTAMAAFEPSLTLGLSGDQTYDKVSVHENPEGSFRQESGGSDEMEIEMEKVGSIIRNEEDDGKKKLRLTKAQSALLEKSFKHNSTLNPKQKKDLARELNLRPRQVEVWFQNRRARTKLKQTEIDCEYLKKCCETLTNENRRLHKELQELKALNFAQPFYTPLPPATLTMCPSCETIGTGAGTGEINGSKNNAPFTRVPMSHFNNHFANESTTC